MYRGLEVESKWDRKMEDVGLLALAKLGQDGVGRSRTYVSSALDLKALRTSARAALLVLSLTVWEKTRVMCRRTPCKMSLREAVDPAFFKLLLTSTVHAGREGGYRTSGGSLIATELARMPLTRQAGLLLGLEAGGSGGTAVRKSDLATIRKRVDLGAPGSSLVTRS